LLLLAGGLFMAFRLFRRDGTPTDAATAKLSEEEQLRLRDILRRTPD
jgi:hypothetical protein